MSNSIITTTPRPWGRFKINNDSLASFVSIVGNLNASQEKQSIVCNTCENDDAKLIIKAVNLLDAHENVMKAAVDICDQIVMYERTHANNYLYDLRDVLQSAIDDVSKLEKEEQ